MLRIMCYYKTIKCIERMIKANKMSEDKKVRFRKYPIIKIHYFPSNDQKNGKYNLSKAEKDRIMKNFGKKRTRSGRSY